MLSNFKDTRKVNETGNCRSSSCDEACTASLLSLKASKTSEIDHIALIKILYNAAAVATCSRSSNFQKNYNGVYFTLMIFKS